mgnify:FL=1
MKGATGISYAWDQAYGISIHAPVKGATPAPGRSRAPATHFNPRTREGCDHIDALLLGDRVHFNPRTREGCDDQHRERFTVPGHFNPRTREGCDIAR